MDPDIILCLYPYKGEGYNGASYAVSILENMSRFLAARPSESPPLDTLKPYNTPPRQERAGTELPEEHEVLEKTDCLVVRFSDGSRTRHGVVCGRAANVDLRLQHLPGISKVHLTFTFDDDNWPIARDLGSSGGTKVIYDGEEVRRRSHFDWQLRGPEILSNKPPVLNFTDKVQFQVVVPPHDVTSQDYLDRVARFREGTADAEDLFASLLLFSGAGTRLPTGTHTPSTRSGPILYKKELGKGQFGIVTYVWNVTTRETYVMKEPLRKPRTPTEIKPWEEEARIMCSIKHVNIAPGAPALSC